MATTKKKKKNRLLPILILALIIAALAIGYKLLSEANARRTAEEAPAANEIVTVTSFDPASLTELSIDGKDSDPLVFRRENGVWTWAEDAHFPLDAAAVEETVTSLSSLTAMREVEGVDASACGLTDPLYTVTLRFGDAAEKAILVGDYNSFGGGRYLMANGSIYLTDENMTGLLGTTLDGLRLDDSIPSGGWTTEGALSSVTITDKGTGESAVITDPTELQQIGITLYNLVKFDECGDYYADADEKTSAGCDDALTVAITARELVTGDDGTSAYLDRTYTVWFGVAAGEGKVWGGLADSDILYAFDESARNALKNNLDSALTEPEDETAEETSDAND